MQFIKDYQQTVSKAIHEYTFTDQSDPLYEPINYITSQHGKRIRPMMVLMANEMFGGDHQKALKPAIGIEIFHNFTLVHDDIMDAVSYTHLDVYKRQVLTVLPILILFLFLQRQMIKGLTAGAVKS